MATVKKEEFIKKLLAALDVEYNEKYHSKTMLRDVPGYDSLAALSIIALADEMFSKKITAMQIQNVTTLESLMETIGKEHFED